MPAGILRLATPTAAMPLSLSRAFTETQTWPARVNEYHDGTSQRSAMLSRPRRSWALTKHLPIAIALALRTFWQAQGVASFYFYNPPETNPPYSYDPTGAATAGRYVVRFASAWGQQTGIAMIDAAVQMVEVLSHGVTLSGDLGILIDKSGSLSAGDLANEKLAAEALVDGVSPLIGYGITVYSFGDTDGNIQECIAVSHDPAAVKAAIAGIPGGGNTPLYDCIYIAATNTTAMALVLMTDGINNIGSHSIAEAIAACVARTVRVFTIGFGAADAEVLRQIATETSGGYYAAATSDNLTAVIRGMLAAVGA